MTRDYAVMRKILAMVAQQRCITFDGFIGVAERGVVTRELMRLKRDGLIDSTLMFDEWDVCEGGQVTCLTAEGIDFWHLIESEEVWRIVYGVLVKASIDISYPLLKEVCEEIVKRYVTSFIPDITRR